MLDQTSSIPFRKVWSQGTLIAALLPRLPYTYFSCTFSALTIFSPGSEIYVLTSVMATYMLHSAMPCNQCTKRHITQYTWHPIYGCWSNCKAVQAGVSQDVLGRACWLPPRYILLPDSLSSLPHPRPGEHLQAKSCLTFDAHRAFSHNQLARIRP